MLTGGGGAPITFERHGGGGVVKTYV